MDEQKQANRSFWRFGGRLDRIYNWLVGFFFVFSFCFHIGRYKGHPEAALGYAIGQTLGVAVVLFVVFKAIAHFARKP